MNFTAAKRGKLRGHKQIFEQLHARGASAQLTAPTDRQPHLEATTSSKKKKKKKKKKGARDAAAPRGRAGRARRRTGRTLTSAEAGYEAAARGGRCPGAAAAILLASATAHLHRG